MRHLLFIIYSTLTLGQDLQSEALNNYFEEHGSNFDEFTLSVYEKKDYEDFPSMSKDYSFNASIDKTFFYYINLAPNIAWNTKKTKFIMMHDTLSHKSFYQNDDLPPLREGQLFFLELKLIKGMLIPVAFQISKIDTQNYTIELTYLEQNKSQGRQILQFTQIFQRNKTVITHTSHFQAGSGIRNILYRPFHTMLVNSFHENFENSIKNDDLEYDYSQRTR